MPKKSRNSEHWRHLGLHNHYIRFCAQARTEPGVEAVILGAVRLSVDLLFKKTFSRRHGLVSDFECVRCEAAGGLECLMSFDYSTR